MAPLERPNWFARVAKAAFPKSKPPAASPQPPVRSMATSGMPRAQRTNYISLPVSIPNTFLKTEPEAPVSFKHVSFADSPVPEYTGCFAIVIDNVLSPSECAQLLELAGQSVPKSSEAESPWRPALVNVGVGWEVPVTDYRNSDRIIWDSQIIADRVWERCLLARGDGESVEELLSKPPDQGSVSGGEWVFDRVNERMRFLKYTKGQYFKGKHITTAAKHNHTNTAIAHCDGAYHYADEKVAFRTHYTVHLYLSDSAKTSAAGVGCVGGATSFLSQDTTRQLDVDPKAGSVLIFQHKDLLHQGAEVHEGTKYTMRTDILYRWVRNSLVKD